MKNRADAGGYRTGSTGPTTMDRVALAPGQFEPQMAAAGRARMAAYSPTAPAYQTAQAAVDNASIGGQPDVTGGSTFFYSPSLNAKLAAERGDRKAVPDWAAGRQPNTTIGTHQFFSPEGKPAQAIAGGQAGQAFAQGPRSSMNDAATERMIAIMEDPRTSPAVRAMAWQQLQQYMQKPQATLEKLKDDEGREVPYWVNSRTQTLTPAQVPGAAAQAAPPTATLPDGTTVTMPQGSSAKEWRKNITQNIADAQSGKNTESQSKAAGFANRMEVAAPDIEKYQSAASGMMDNTIQGIPLVPDKLKNYGLSEPFQLYTSAKGRWISGFLRRDSGAVINQDEFAREDKNFFPQPGDPPALVEAKRRARAEATEAMKREAGLSYKSPSIPQSDGGGWVDVGNGVRIREKR
jgi:hypothetical protein